MHGRIDENAAGLYLLAGMGPTTFDDCGQVSPIAVVDGRESPVATCHTPRPDEGHDADTTAGQTTDGWCL